MPDFFGRGRHVEDVDNCIRKLEIRLRKRDFSLHLFLCRKYLGVLTCYIGGTKNYASH